MSGDHQFTRRERDCILLLGSELRNGFPDRISDIARRMGIKAPTVIQILKRLDVKGITRSEKGMVILTDSGREAHRRILENHRILECIFYRNGITANESCVVAGSIDYVIDGDIIGKLSQSLGMPEK